MRGARVSPVSNARAVSMSGGLLVCRFDGGKSRQAPIAIEVDCSFAGLQRERRITREMLRVGR
eukprot:10331568-Lingulodinium_polyedra.AAC.1